MTDDVEEPPETPDWELDRVRIDTADGGLAIASLTESGEWVRGDNPVSLSDAL